MKHLALSLIAAAAGIAIKRWQPAQADTTTAAAAPAAAQPEGNGKEKSHPIAETNMHEDYSRSHHLKSDAEWRAFISEVKSMPAERRAMFGYVALAFAAKTWGGEEKYAAELAAWPDESAREKLVAACCQAWAKRDATEALTWARQHFVDDVPLRTVALRSIILTWPDAAQAIKTLPLKEVLAYSADRTSSDLIMRWGQTDAEAAVQWALSITDGADRNAAFRLFFPYSPDATYPFSWEQMCMVYAELNPDDAKDCRKLLYQAGAFKAPDKAWAAALEEGQAEGISAIAETLVRKNRPALLRLLNGMTPADIARLPAAWDAGLVQQGLMETLQPGDEKDMKFLASLSQQVKDRLSPGMKAMLNPAPPPPQTSPKIEEIERMLNTPHPSLRDHRADLEAIANGTGAAGDGVASLTMLEGEDTGAAREFAMRPGILDLPGVRAWLVPRLEVSDPAQAVTVAQGAGDTTLLIRCLNALAAKDPGAAARELKAGGLPEPEMKSLALKIKELQAVENWQP